MRTLLILVVTIAAVILLVMGFRYYMYVTNTQTPYDEVGIELNQYMPGPIRNWGCGKLKQTFGAKTLPPFGCEGADPKTWR